MLKRRVPNRKFRLWFLGRRPIEANGEARRAEPTSPFFAAFDQKCQILAHTKGCCKRNQYVMLSSTVLLQTLARQQTVLPSCRVSIPCAIAQKSLKMADFSKTGSRNMAETCANDFLTTVSYSTSIVLGGLQWLLLTVLTWGGAGLKQFFGQKLHGTVLEFFPSLIAHGTKTGRAGVLIFGTAGEYQMLYEK